MLLWGPCRLLWGGVFCEAASLGFIRLSVSLTDQRFTKLDLSVLVPLMLYLGEVLTC